MKIPSTREAAVRLGVSDRRVRALIDAVTLASHQIGREYAIEEKALEGVTVCDTPGRPPKPKVETTSGQASPRRAAKKVAGR